MEQGKRSRSPRKSDSPRKSRSPSPAKTPRRQSRSPVKSVKTPAKTAVPKTPRKSPQTPKKTQNSSTTVKAAAATSASIFVIFLSCFIYGSASSWLTFVNKKVYAVFGDISPMNILMTQCAVNVIMCILLMAYKDLSQDAFASLKPFGIVIPPLSSISEKARLGIKAGMSNLITVIFGLYAVKNTPIPMFLAFRRCAMLSSVITMFLLKGEKPNRSLVFSTFLIVVGALIAAHGTLERDMLGFALVWANNFSQSTLNVYVQTLNADKKLSSFDINFFFACVGLFVTLIYNCVVTSDYQQLSENYFTENGNTFALMLGGSGAAGIILTLSVLSVCATGGPIMVNVTGTIKDVFLTYVGFAFFNDTKVTQSVLIGLTLSFAGALNTIIQKYKASFQEKQAEKAQKKTK